MKKSVSLLIAILLILSCNSCMKEKSVFSPEEVKQITGRYEKILSESNDLTRFPRTITGNGDLVSTDIYDWTSGFLQETCGIFMRSQAMTPGNGKQ
ncbi:MAG: hypothetical protein IPN67_21815 [Bacteroidales bacterium]|nr:hypothetical protein [Bacteroidales bacterium]